MSQQSTTLDAPPAGFTPPTHRQILTILGGLMLGMFLAALDQTIVATSIRTIGDDLKGLPLQAWVTTAYLLTSTIVTPLYGKLSDIYGRKPFYLLAISLFVFGSLLSGSATSMYELALYRGIQGLGAGGLMALAITILGDLVAPRERARYQGYFLAVFGISSVLGPVIGGFFAGTETILGIAGWRWVFLINVPIGIVALVVVSRVLHLPPLHKVAHKIDWQGAVALVITLVPLLIVAEQGREWGWTSQKAVAAYATGVVGLALFLLFERRAGKDAILPLYLFRNRVFSMGAGANTVIGLGMFGGLATLPLYLQIVKGQSPTQAGLTLIPFTLGIMAGSVIAGQTTSRTGRYKVFPVAGTILMGLGSLLFSRLNADSGLPTIFAISVVFGLGLGFTMQPLVLAVQNAVPVRDMGVATSSSLFFRQVGGTLGTAVFLSVLFSTVGTNITNALKRAYATPQFQAALNDPTLIGDKLNGPIIAGIKAVANGQSTGGFSLDNSSFINQIDDRLAHPFQVGFSESVDTVLLLAAIIMVVAIVLVILMPELPLRSFSGLEGRMAEQAGDAAGPATAAATAAPEDAVLEPVGATVEPPAQAATAVTAVAGVASIVADRAAVERSEAGPDGSA
ncbi:MDR family MFS transporter [Cellulomonas alba]|uniref:MDR family MFS transporter n=1 Tax=Cellulomonas alba TaxID=3053467 RepID=A0ABT7SFE0_9CELL|nr:MDR family MFS transporter [Cellulomonas alba]MDM7854905.1 MDR family MFS transporter [Cellulomonas alba]